MVHDNEPLGSQDEFIDGQNGLSLYRAVLAAREIDLKEQELVRRGLAFFHVSGAGHEGTAALAAHLTSADWLHCHYRDKALLLARGLPIREFFLSLLCRAGSHSEGRQMSAHLSAPEWKVLSIVGPVGNNALQAVGVAAELKHRGEPGLVVCSTGEGTTQEGEFLEAVAEAVRDELPVLFLIQDNSWAISTPTGGRTFFSRPGGPAREFYGMPIHQVDGRDPVAAGGKLGPIVRELRDSGRPALVWFQVERLAHSNADDQTLYRDEAEIAAASATADPVANMRRRLLEMGVEPGVLEAFERDVAAEVASAAEAAIAAGEPVATLEAKRPLPSATAPLPLHSREGRGEGSPSRHDACRSSPSDGATLPMGTALRETLRHWLISDERVVLIGEDIEDPKGDVFGVTRGLSSEFPGRVRNSALSESTIVGVSIGRALAGARPVAFLQFADFLPLAYNQLASELGSLYWRTAGAWQAPVVVLVTCGGYKPGLGPFHSQTLESVAAHIPGVDVVMPHTAADAAGLLNAAFASGRPTLFFYPKSCLNLGERATSEAVERQFVPLGSCRTVRPGTDLTFVSWGYPVLLCEKAAAALAECGVEAEVLDLRSLSPWDEAAVCESAERTGRLVVVHEDNHTCGFGAEVVATVAERASRRVQCRRVTRADTWVPCHFPSQLEVLPSFRRVLAVAAGLLDLELTWDAEPGEQAGSVTVDTIGSGPADETVIITDVLVAPGATVAEGDVVATAEALKSIVEISSNVAGVVEEVLVAVGDSVPVGQPLMRIRVRTGQKHQKAIVQEQCGRPILKRRALVVPPSGNGVRGEHVVSNGKPADAGTTSAEEACRDVPVSARQRLLNRRMEQSRSIPQGDLTVALPRQTITQAASWLRKRFAELPIGELDVLAWCAAQAAGMSPRLRSALINDGTLREYESLNLGIAVHLEGDDLATAVVRGADQLSFPDFLATMQRQIELARDGADQASHNVQLLITHLGGLPIHAARPVLIAPAAGILFVGAPASGPDGEVINLTLGFDHRIVNGVAAARFLTEIVRALERLPQQAGPRGNGHAAAAEPERGQFRRVIESAPAAARRRVLEEHVCETVAGLLAVDRSRIEPAVPLRNLGLESLHAAELAFALERSLDVTVPPTLVWNRPTVREIAEFLLEQLGGGDVGGGVSADSCPPLASPAALLGEIERLSDDQVRTLLEMLPGSCEHQESDRVAP